MKMTTEEIEASNASRGIARDTTHTSMQGNPT